MWVMMRLAVFAALAAAVGGCLTSDAIECTGADGVTVLCPAHASCVVVGSAAACQTPQAVCGDGIVEAGEVCDDGNTTSGDGCSADCQSDETCGNGIIDAIKGEVCDDGNVFAHDGCDSTCAPEFPHWIQLASQAEPSDRTSTAIAYDAHHGDVVMFGGTDTSDGAELADTWVWKHGWLQLQPLKSPSPRRAHAMAYAGVDGGVYLYGGAVGGIPLGDLWRWDGTSWNDIELPVDAPQPPPLASASLVYDPKRAVLVLFGGDTGGGAASGATWELDVAAQTWSLVDTAGPPARFHQAMAYDPIDQYIVMYGGQLSMPSDGASAGSALADTWTYADGAWTEQSPGMTEPPATSSGAMGFDGAHVVLVAGLLQAGGLPDTYLWTGSGWTPRPSSPSSVQGTTLAFEPPDQLLLFGGTPGGFVVSGGGDATSVGLGFKTGLWTDPGAAGGNGWSNATPALFPRAAGGAALDLGLGVPILFGGTTPPPTLQEGFALSNDTSDDVLGLVDDAWTVLAFGTNSPAIPATHVGLAAAYDEGARETLFFGGSVTDGSDALVTNDTWSWQAGRGGSAAAGWKLEQPAVAPDPRIGHAMAYDAARGVVVMFGGEPISKGDPLGDTWEWSGSNGTWTARAGTASPAARTNASLAYDRTHHEIVLFGGRGAAALLGDTWLLDASGWRLVVPPTSPTPRAGAAMGWDPARRRVVLFGGDTRIAEQDTWEWDGSSWTQLPTPSPPPRAGGMIVGTGDGVLLFGGAASIDATDGQFSDLWLLRYDGSHAGETCRGPTDDDGDGQAGCADADCWLQCTPMCLPGDTCSAPPPDPRCGDGVCGLDETDDLCPDDCTIAICGDGQCSPIDCPGDCP
jgi:cysteine-rich repeat protein